MAEYIRENDCRIWRFTSNPAFLWATALNPDIADKRDWGPEDVEGRKCTLVVGVYEGAKGKKNKVLEVKPPYAKEAS